jgi:hypothetical protein
MRYQQNAIKVKELTVLKKWVLKFQLISAIAFMRIKKSFLSLTHNNQLLTKSI